ncbi:MAG TPA: hypothetical protein VHQ47_10940 [Phycisphaerae bacterium]|nr:hypothetical protein [Phycisphaerae bacterium]
MTHRSLTTCALALALLSAAPVARAQPLDTTLDTAERFLARALQEAQDTAISSTRETGPVLAALRTSHDPGLVPIFQSLRQSTIPENQMYGMVAIATLTKNPADIDMKLLLSTKDTGLVGSAIATLTDTSVITNDQLQQIVTSANDPAQKAMAAGELNHRGALKDRSILTTLLNSDKDVVRYYAALSILETTSIASTQPGAGGGGGAGGGVNSQETAAALAALNDMSQSHDLRQAPVQALMIVRAQKQNITAAGPWIVSIARDPQNDEGLRYTALTALLTLNNPAAPAILTDMIQAQHETIQQIKLGLISLQFASRLSPDALAPLVNAHNPLAKSVAELARQVAANPATDITPGLIKLLKDGTPIILDWALVYSDTTDPDRRLALRSVIINAATIVDENRGADYERAALAAEKCVDDSPAGQRLVASLLASDNRAVVEACLAGIYRSDMKNQSSLVSPFFSRFTTTPHLETIANYAALILAREGHSEALTWLPNMVLGSTVQNPGFRALAGWYYAKLKNKTPEFLQAALKPQ